MRRLHDQTVRPIATAETRGAFYRQWQIVSIDGATLDVADETSSAKSFGRPGASRGQVRIRKFGLFRWLKTAPTFCLELRWSLPLQ